MPHFSLKRLLVRTALVAAALGLGQAQFQLIRAVRSTPLVLAALGILSSGLFYCGLMSLDRHSRKWWAVCAIVGTVYVYFMVRRVEFALAQNLFRPLQ